MEKQGLLWYGGEVERRALAPDAKPVAGVGSKDVEIPADTVVVVEASFGARRAERPGLNWLQRLRRETTSLAPALIYSFESRETLAQAFSMLAEGVPGVGFLRAPFTRAELQRAVSGLGPLTRQELQEIRRWHSGLQVEASRQAHDLGSLLIDWPHQRDQARRLVAQWGREIRAFSPDQIPNLQRLVEALERPAPEVRRALQVLEDGILGRHRIETDALPTAPFDRPPAGFEAIAVADDSGYVPATMRQLARLGYTVFGPARSREQAEALFQNSLPAVVLADLNFPSAAQGHALFQLALNTRSVRLVIAISRARPETGALPNGVVDCCGGLDFQDADRIHRLIWRRALTVGVTEHA
jgi:CheY-like chemotaxis protein